MKKSVLSSAILGGILAAAAFAVPAHAQATRTWVSGVGDDANPCSRTAPCKTFAGAISKTATGGEINCLDPAGYGAITIGKNLTIDCAWTHGSILAANFNGVIINGAGIVVNLRGLSINGATTTTGNGIRILNAARVNIDNVVIENFGGTGTNGKGVNIATSAAGVEVTVQNSRLANLNNIGIHSNPTGGDVKLTVSKTSLVHGRSTGIQLRQLTKALIDHTSITDHTIAAAVTLELSNVSAAISNSVLSDNAFGVFNGNGGGAPTSRLFANVISGNTTQGIQINGGLVISAGNNLILGNTAGEAVSSNAGTQ